MVIDTLAADRLDELEPLWSSLREHHDEVGVEWLPEVRTRADSWRLRRAQYEGWLRGGEGFALVARDDDGRALGYAFVLMGAGSATWPLGDRLADIETLAVLPEARGGGVGAALLDVTRREAAGRGGVGISLMVAEGNDDATRFYEREGFQPFARLLFAPIDVPPAG